jgi:hypothetical protein
VPVYGNAVMAYGMPGMTLDFTTLMEVIDQMHRPGQPLGREALEYQTYRTDYSWYVKLAYGDGPIQGIIPGTEKINGQLPSTYTGLTLEHRRGTDKQTAVTLGDRIQYQAGLKCEYNVPVTYTFPDKDIAALGIIVSCPNGCLHYGSGGGGAVAGHL